MRGKVGAPAAAMMMVMVCGVVAGAQTLQRKTPPPVAQPAQAQVEVHSTVNRTAVWVGDPIVWTVEFVCAPMVDVIADDLAGDKLALQGLELVGSDTERTTGPDGGIVHRVTYQLKTYDIGLQALQVAPFVVRYFVRRPGQRAEDLTPAGQVDVPGVVLAWRSTIPGGLKTLDLREQRAAEPIPVVLRVARPIGLTLIVVSVAPVMIWGFSLLRRVRLPRDRRPSVRASRREARKALQKLRALDLMTEKDRRDGYAQLNTVLRRFVAQTSGLPAMALTFEETAARLGRTGGRPGHEAIAEALAECDRACYGQAELVPSSEQFRDSIAVLERVL